jgi:type I restriction enzyme S subunit
MSEWSKARLADVAEIRFSNVDKRTIPGEVPVRLCNYMDAYGNGGYITNDLPFMEASVSTVEAERFRVEYGDVMLTKDSETPDDIGIPAVVVDEIQNLVCGYHLALIRPNPEQIDSVYLAKQLGSKSTARYFSRLANGSTRYGLSSSSIAYTLIPLAPLPQQRRIAEILSTVDEAIEQTEALIVKYQQIKAGLMQDLFTRGITPDGHLRPTRGQAPHLYKESPLSWIPKEWDCFATEDKVRVIDAQPDHRTPPEDSEGYPYIGIGDISSAGEVLFGQARRVLSTAFTKQLNSFEVEPGAFIFGKIGTLGSPTRIPHERFFAISANVVLLTSKVSSDANFTFWIYHSQWIERQISDATNTTSQPALGIQKIRKFILPWPSTSSEREVITSRLENMLQVHQSLEREKHKMILLKHGLMHGLLTGRVRVKVGEPANT